MVEIFQTINVCLQEKQDERLSSLDVLGVEDSENDQLDVMKEFEENICRKEDGRLSECIMDAWSQINKNK